LLGLIKTRPPANERHARYLQTLEEFNFEICYVKGKENISADYLSRLTSANISTEDTFSEIKRDELIAEYHNQGHFSTNKVRKALLQAGHWFPLMRRKLWEFSNNCEVCKRAKAYTPPAKKGSLPKQNDVEPREFVSIDIVGPVESAPGGFRYIVTMVDHATRWLQAVPVTDITSKTVAKVFVENWVLQYGPPRYVHSDNGKQFIAKIFKDMCQSHNILTSRTTIYHPQGNAILERSHATLKDRLRCSVLEGAGPWTQNLTRALYNINRTENSTGLSAFTTFLGFQPKSAGDWSSTKDKIVDPELPCPVKVYPKIFVRSGSLSPRFKQAVPVVSRVSHQLVRGLDNKTYHLSNCKVVW